MTNIPKLGLAYPLVHMDFNCPEFYMASRTCPRFSDNPQPEPSRVKILVPLLLLGLTVILFITIHSEQGRDTLAMLMPKDSVSFNEKEAAFLFLCGLAKLGRDF